MLALLVNILWQMVVGIGPGIPNFATMPHSVRNLTLRRVFLRPELPGAELAWSCTAVPEEPGRKGALNTFHCDDCTADDVLTPLAAGGSHPYNCSFR